MNLQNGYKVIYEKAADGKRTFYASKTGFFKDAEQIMETDIGAYKLIYEKDGKFYGSTTGIPTADDHCFEELRVVFEEGYVKADTTSETPIVEPEQEATETPEAGSSVVNEPTDNDEEIVE